jgi:hypothetical protein
MSHINIAITALTLILLSSSRHGFGSGTGPDKNIPEDRGDEKIRVLVMDLSSDSDMVDAIKISKIIRNALVKRKDVAILEIAAINSLVATGDFIKNKFKDEIEYSQYIGKKLNAHKIILGSVKHDGDTIKVESMMIDIATGKIESRKNFNIDKKDLERKAVELSEDIIRDVIVHAPWKTGRGPYYYEPEAVASTGILSSLGRNEKYIKPGFLTMVKAGINLPAASMRIDMSAGYGLFDLDGIKGGTGSLVLMPFLLTVYKPFSLSENPIIPKPMIIAGGGIRYFRLTKKQYGDIFTYTGTHVIWAVGAGFSITPFDKIFIRAEFMYNYICDDDSASYIYSCVGIGIRI